MKPREGFRLVSGHVVTVYCERLEAEAAAARRSMMAQLNEILRERYGLPPETTPPPKRAGRKPAPATKPKKRGKKA